MADEFEKLKQKVNARISPSSGSRSDTGATSKDVSVSPTTTTAPDDEQESPVSVPEKKQHRTTVKEQVNIEEILLRNGKIFTFHGWSNIAVSFINKRDASSGFDFLERLQDMLKQFGYLSERIDFPRKLPDQSEYDSKYRPHIDQIIASTAAFARDLSAAMNGAKKQAEKQGKVIAGFNNQEGYGRGLWHWATEAQRKVEDEINARTEGKGTPFTFDPLPYSNWFPLEPENISEFLNRIAVLAGPENEIIFDIDPATKQITPRYKKRKTDVMNEIYRLVQVDPTIAKLYKRPG